MNLLLVVFALCAQATPGFPQAPRGGLGRAFALDGPRLERGDCVPAPLRARVADVLSSAPPVAPGTAKQLAAPPLLPFFPIGGSISGDCFLGGYVDTDPAPDSFRNFSCHDFTYDGHRGHDAALRSFAQQALGVPVFAVRDGTVAFAQDGFPDENLFPGADDGNYVVLDHGDGTASLYFHLKSGSVAFTSGATVRAGEQLGLAASSGYSFGPHLHFEVQQAGQASEPFAGACSGPESGWARQEALVLDTRLLGFGVTTTDLSTVPGLPHPWPASAQIAVTERDQYIWAQGVNLPPDSVYRFRFLRPDGSLEWETPEWPLLNDEWWRTFGVWFWFSIPAMSTAPGTWTIQLEFNGEQHVSAPVDVVPVVDPGFNRPPAPITAALDPPVPGPGQVVFCRVAAPLPIEDPDFDLVSFRYEWTVNAQVVRDATVAGHADALPGHLLALGDSVSCTVTASDGQLLGTPVVAGAVVAPQGFTNVGHGKSAQWDVPFLEGSGTLAPLSPGGLSLSQARPAATALLFLGVTPGWLPLKGGTLVPDPILLTVFLVTDAEGGIELGFLWPGSLPPGVNFYLQTWIADPDAPAGASASNGIRGTTS